MVWVIVEFLVSPFFRVICCFPFTQFSIFSVSCKCELFFVHLVVELSEDIPTLYEVQLHPLYYPVPWKLSLDPERFLCPDICLVSVFSSIVSRRGPTMYPSASRARFGTVALTDSERTGLWRACSERPNMLFMIVDKLVNVTGVR